VLFCLLANVDRVDGVVASCRRVGNCRGKRASAELDAGDRRNGTWEISNSREQSLPDQDVTSCKQHSRLAVDEKVAFLSGAQDEATTTETPFPEKLEKLIHGPVAPRPGRLRNRELCVPFLLSG